MNKDSGGLIGRVLIKSPEQDLKKQHDIRVWATSQHKMQMRKTMGQR